LPYAALNRILNPRQTRFNQDYLKARLLNRPCDTTVAAADIEQRSSGWKELQCFKNAAISMLKPK
jgi:hypothetical protein